MKDDNISEEEATYLSSLRALLTLSPQEISEAEGLVIHPRYNRALSEFLADKKITDEESKHLELLSGALRLSAEATSALMKASVMPILTP